MHLGSFGRMAAEFLNQTYFSLETRTEGRALSVTAAPVLLDPD